MPDTLAASSYKDVALASTLNTMTLEDRSRAVIYFNQTMLPAGPINVGGATIQSDKPMLLTFVDLRPGANWMHECKYVLIDPSSGETLGAPADRPPVVGGPLPPSWCVLWQTPGTESWRLIPIAPASPDAAPHPPA